jgi:hypothetical protein
MAASQEGLSSMSELNLSWKFMRSPPNLRIPFQLLKQLTDFHENWHEVLEATYVYNSLKSAKIIWGSANWSGWCDMEEVWNISLTFGLMAITIGPLEPGMWKCGRKITIKLGNTWLINTVNNNNHSWSYIRAVGTDGEKGQRSASSSMQKYKASTYSYSESCVNRTAW